MRSESLKQRASSNSGRQESTAHKSKTSPNKKKQIKKGKVPSFFIYFQFNSHAVHFLEQEVDCCSAHRVFYRDERDAPTPHLLRGCGVKVCTEEEMLLATARPTEDLALGD
jgi:hypothetical protein